MSKFNAIAKDLSPGDYVLVGNKPTKIVSMKGNETSGIIDLTCENELDKTTPLVLQIKSDSPVTRVVAA